MKILIVDDWPDNVFLLKEVLALMGFDCILAENGQEAVDQVKNEEFAAVFMDIEMPVMNGFEATEEIRTQLPNPKSEIPVFAISAHSHNFLEEKRKKVGITDYVAKPYTHSNIESILEKYQIL